MGTSSPSSPALPGTHRVVPPLIFHSYILFCLHNRYFIGPFEMWGDKNLRNRNRKNAIMYKLPTTGNPAKRGMKWIQIELAMLDFRMEHCQLNPRARSGFLFGNVRLPLLDPRWARHFALRFGAAYFARGPAPAGMYYANLYLG